jgi:hypothetical protein
LLGFLLWQLSVNLNEDVVLDVDVGVDPPARLAEILVVVLDRLKVLL